MEDQQYNGDISSGSSGNSFRKLAVPIAVVLVVIILAIGLIIFFSNRSNKSSNNNGKSSNSSKVATPPVNSNSNNSNSSSSTAPSNTKPTPLSNAGPGNTVALFVGVAAVAGFAHYIYSSKKNRSITKSSDQS
jgi:hypothetical protein